MKSTSSLHNMRLIVCVLIFASCCLKTSAQTFTLQGRVTDPDLNPIELASVAVVSQGRVAVTSLKGEFQLSLISQDSVVVRISMLGYKTKTRVLRNPKGKQTLQVVLHEDNTQLAQVDVIGQRIETGQSEDLKIDATRKSPSATGNAVEELVQMQAGVNSNNELSSQYNVRGGAYDENSVYLNGVELYRPFLVRSGQQEGLSVINPDMVDRVRFSTGGFESKYGDKMSSALDITYRRPTRWEGSLQASMLGGSAYVGYGNKKFSWSNGIRYKTTKYLLGTLETKGEYKPTFLDYQTYLTYQPNKRWDISFIGDISENKYNFEPEDRETRFGTMESVRAFRVYFDGQERDLFQTYFGNLTITHHFSPQTHLSLLASAFSTKEQEKYDIQGQYWLTQTETSENLGVGTFFEHTRNHLKANVQSVKLRLQHAVAKHQIEAAVTFKREHIEESTVEYEMRDSAGYSVPHTGEDLYMIYSQRAKNKLDANRIESYLQDTWRFQSRGITEGDSVKREPTLYTLNYGIRLSHWNFNQETIVSPRFSLGIIPGWNQNITMRFAGGLYYQAPFFKELRDTFTVNHVTHVKLNEKIKSQRSIHFIAGLDYRFKMNNRPFKFTAEAYYKALSNLIPYSVNNVKVVYYGDNKASGHAAGLDLKLYGEFVPGTDSWITLSLMDTKMNLNGKKIPLPTDQRYAINLFFTDYFPHTDRWLMSLKLIYADGLPFSAPHQELERNSFRAPAYKRADIGMSYRLLNNEKRERKSIFRNIWLGVDCLNLLGIENVNSYYWITDVTNHQYAVPNYLTGRQINAKVIFEL